MYIAALAALRCLTCRAPLRLTEQTADASGEIVAGMLACEGCDAHYPIRDGIADLLGRPRPASVAQLSNELPPTAWVYERGWRPFALTMLSGEPFPYGRELPLVTGMLDVRRGGLFVDVGCSNGLYARAIAREVGASGHVIGVDQAMPMLTEARRRARDAGLAISYVRARAQELPLASDSAAGVAIGGSLNEIGDLDGCLAEVRRTLGPEGRFAAMTLVRAAGPVGQSVQQLLNAGGVAFWTADELVGHFAAHGLRTLRREQYGVVLFTLCVR